MTKDEINRAIADACGASYKLQADVVMGLQDYCNDLNAMHSAEQTLRQNQFHYVGYPHRLFEVIASPKKWDGDLGYFAFTFVTATAAQRAEAFLRTLGKWKDTP